MLNTRYLRNIDAKDEMDARSRKPEDYFQKRIGNEDLQ
jgi:hypothetical protein